MQQQDQYEHSSECQDYADYGPEGYHPVCLGQKFNGNYTIIQKLGWGHFSTVWLVQNQMKANQYSALKIQRSKDNHADSALDQLKILSELTKHQNNQKWIELISTLCNQYPKILPHIQLIRPLQLRDNFAHHGIHGKHYCSVFQLLGPNLLDLIQHYEFQDERMPLWLVKKITIDVLLGLEYLHTYCNIIHTDLKPENIMIKMNPQQEEQLVKQIKQYKIKPISMKYLKNLEGTKNSKAKKKNEKKKLKKKLKKEKEQTDNKQKEEVDELGQQIISKQKQLSSQNLENSQSNLASVEEKNIQEEEVKILQEDKPQDIEQKPDAKKKEQSDHPDMRFLKWKNLKIELTTDLFFKVVDMGNACFVNHHYTQDIQTRQYRAPEVLLGLSYGPTTDIWSLACTIFEMLTNNFLFKPKKISGISKDEDHLYRLIQVLGPISKEQALGGTQSNKFFNKKGKLLNGHPKEHARLNELFRQDYGYSLQDSVEIEQFLLPMLEIDDEKRITARECLKNQWLWN